MLVLDVMITLDNSRLIFGCSNCWGTIKHRAVWFKREGVFCPYCSCALSTTDFCRKIDLENKWLADFEAKINRACN